MFSQYTVRRGQENSDGLERRGGRERGIRSPRVFAPGDLKLLLLALIAEQPCHGYDLILQIEAQGTEASTPNKARIQRQHVASVEPAQG